MAMLPKICSYIRGLLYSTGLLVNARCCERATCNPGKSAEKDAPQARGCSAARHSQPCPASITPSSGMLYQTGSDELSQEPACRHHTTVSLKRQLEFYSDWKGKEKDILCAEKLPKAGLGQQESNYKGRRHLEQSLSTG